jgi:creatinine amidohydrolase
MPTEFSNISGFNLDTLPRERSVFFFAVGPMEDHGVHLPVGLDVQEAGRLCFMTAKYLEQEMSGWVGVIMPPAPLGIDSNTTRIAITVRAHVLRDWLVDACRSLMRMGFLHFVCFSGHLGPKQLTAIEEAGAAIGRMGNLGRLTGLFRGRKYEGRATLVSASSALVPARTVAESPFWPDPCEHGGKRDTSIALTLVSGGGLLSNYAQLPAVERSASRWIRNWKRRRKVLSGYWGEPRAARAELGETEILDTLEKLFPKLRAVWEGSNPNSLFRSWYSILPPNKSFFKAWIMLVLVVVILYCWASQFAATLEWTH